MTAERLLIPMIQALRKATKSDEPLDILLSDTLVQAAFEAKCLGLFWESFLPFGCPIPETTTSSSWTLLAQDLYLHEPILRKALVALALANIGKRDNKQGMRDTGLRIYGKALCGMRVALLNPSQVNYDGILVATKIMSLFEMFHGDDRQDKVAQARAWLDHVKGEIALFLGRGPKGCASGVSHRMFRDGRAIMVLPSIYRRKKSILSSPAWKHIPWSLVPKSATDSLVDILVDIPIVLEKWDDLQGETNPGEKQKLQEALLQTCWKYDRDLLAWFTSFGPVKVAEDFDYNAQISTKDIARAHTLNLYWTTCLILYNVMCRAAVSQTELPARIDPLICCRHIARSLPIFLKKSSGWWGLSVALFPMGMALRFLATKKDSEEYSRIRCFIDHETQGFHLSQFLSSSRRNTSALLLHNVQGII
ncbi:hypothetical protein TrVFT333_010682 [Trichoderma virens FT-333]|nr:hypothetical protein TrVFT333_010682 [Trichoderma virens FT-333]